VWLADELAREAPQQIDIERVLETDNQFVYTNGLVHRDPLADRVRSTDESVGSDEDVGSDEIVLLAMLLPSVVAQAGLTRG
jgi:hypothetical protein